MSMETLFRFWFAHQRFFYSSSNDCKFLIFYRSWLNLAVTKFYITLRLLMVTVAFSNNFIASCFFIWMCIGILCIDICNIKKCDYACYTPINNLSFYIAFILNVKWKNSQAFEQECLMTSQRQVDLGLVT